MELFKTSGMPKLIKTLLKLFNKSFVERIDSWENAGEGLIAVCLENYRTDLQEETNILKKHGHEFFQIKARRKDTKGRLLKFTCVFPNEIKIPFFMTYFNIDPKPKIFVHPNGVKSISSISFGTTEELIPIINELCDDPILKLYIGDGVKDMVYEKIESKVKKNVKTFDTMLFKRGSEYEKVSGNIIQVEDLHFRYIGRKAAALAGVNVEISSGETVLLLGPSGSGKSTLALSFNGLVTQKINGRMNGRVGIYDMVLATLGN